MIVLIEVRKSERIEDGWMPRVAASYVAVNGQLIFKRCGERQGGVGRERPRAFGANDTWLDTY